MNIEFYYKLQKLTKFRCSPPLDYISDAGYDNYEHVETSCKSLRKEYVPKQLSTTKNEIAEVLQNSTFIQKITVEDCL